MITAGFVCFVGSVDDRFDLPSRVKLVLQIVSVLPIVLCGYYVDRVVAFGHPIELGWIGIPLTVLWLIGCINALNLLDGMDGLASIVGLSTAAMMGVIAASEGHHHVAVMVTVLAASLLGFLMYNLPPASVFLGDSGSMVIGLSVGLLGIQGSLKTSATLAITAPAVVMTLPMFDIIAAMVRRKLTGRRFDAPDRLHIHHRLLDRGWTPWQILCLAGAICLTTGAAATAATIFRRDALAWITAMSMVVLMIRLRLFGYEEFALAKGAVVARFGSCMWTLWRGLPRGWEVQGSGFEGSGACDRDGTAKPERSNFSPEPRPLSPDRCAVGHFAPQRPALGHSPGGVLFVPRRSLPAYPLDGSRRPSGASLAVGRSRCRCPTQPASFANSVPSSARPITDARRLCGIDLVAEDIRRPFRRARRPGFRPAGGRRRAGRGRSDIPISNAKQRRSQDPIRERTLVRVQMSKNRGPMRH